MALALAALTLSMLFVPLGPKPRIRDESAALRSAFQAIGPRLSKVGQLTLVVVVHSADRISVDKISISGHALAGRTITVVSVDDFSRVLSTFRGPGTAVVGFDPALGGAVLNPAPEIVQTQRRLKQILSERGFDDPLAE